MLFGKAKSLPLCVAIHQMASLGFLQEKFIKAHLKLLILASSWAQIRAHIGKEAVRDEKAWELKGDTWGRDVMCLRRTYGTAAQEMEPAWNRLKGRVEACSGCLQTNWVITGIQQQLTG